MRAGLVLALTAAPALAQTVAWEQTVTETGCSARTVYDDQGIVLFFFGFETDEMSFYVSDPDMTVEDEADAPATVGFDEIEPWTLPMEGFEADGFPGVIASRAMDDTMELFLEEASGAERLEISFEDGSGTFAFAIGGAGPASEEARACFEKGVPVDGAAPRASAARQG